MMRFNFGDSVASGFSTVSNRLSQIKAIRAHLEDAQKLREEEFKQNVRLERFRDAKIMRDAKKDPNLSEEEFLALGADFKKEFPVDGGLEDAENIVETYGRGASEVRQDHRDRFIQDYYPTGKKAVNDYTKERLSYYGYPMSSLTPTGNSRGLGGSYESLY